MLRDRVIDLECAMDASEQYSRRNNVRIFGIPESPESNESTDDIVIKLCNTLNVDVSVNEIDRLTGLENVADVTPAYNRQVH
ncbi:hypothetical protein DPMN_100408 [Dreissena polymorpha]|uniref:Uncharacterized protein n=1 Tax=Dreissena polymorpha TaxID=45954 RepID=A0A9D4LHH6_DREPO|nr:hypothetical protein DPMN_100408 [Dreissena polymorpha]